MTHESLLLLTITILVLLLLFEPLFRSFLIVCGAAVEFAFRAAPHWIKFQFRIVTLTTKYWFRIACAYIKHWTTPQRRA